MMDTTPKYILMCEKTGEVQKGWKRRIGDYIYDGVNIQISTGAAWEDVDLGVLSYSSVIIETIKGAVGMGYFRWLPRQDQLQAMVETKDPLDLLELFYEETHFQYELMSEATYSGSWLPRKEYEQFNSMEQLWLAFVMKEKYQKVWSTTKKDWLHEKD